MKRKITMTREEAEKYLAEQHAKRMPGYKRLQVERAMAERRAAIEALKKPKRNKKVVIKKQICRHGRDTWADDCNMCEMFGSDELLKRNRTRAPRKSIVAIAETVKDRYMQYGIYAVSLAEEILRLNKVHENDAG